MYQHPQYRAEKLTVEPFGHVEINRNAEFIICLEASAPFTISFDDAPRTNFEKGLSYEAQVPFNKVRIENATDEPLTLNVGMGRGGIKDARFVVSGAIQAEISAPAIMDTFNTFSVSQQVSSLVSGQDAKRKEIVIRNISTEGRVWLRSDTATVEGGYPLNAGEVAALTTAAAIYAFNDGTAPVQLTALSISEEF